MYHSARVSPQTKEKRSWQQRESQAARVGEFIIMRTRGGELHNMKKRSWCLMRSYKKEVVMFSLGVWVAAMPVAVDGE